MELNNKMAEVDISIRELTQKHKELVKMELGEMHESKDHYKRKFEEAKKRSADFMGKIDEFKKRFMQ